MSFDYPARISALPHEQQLRFYELFAHNLTIAVRAIWDDLNLTDTQKVDQMKWMNEILHRVTAKIAVVRLHLHDWPETAFWAMIQHWVAQNRAIGGHVGWAIQTSYTALETIAE